MEELLLLSVAIMNIISLAFILDSDKSISSPHLLEANGTRYQYDASRPREDR